MQENAETFFFFVNNDAQHLFRKKSKLAVAAWRFADITLACVNELLKRELDKLTGGEFGILTLCVLTRLSSTGCPISLDTCGILTYNKNL